MKKKTLASQLNTRVELWNNELIDGESGKELVKTKVRDVWARIVPTGGSTSDGDGDTEYSKVKFKVDVRKQDITKNHWLIYEGMELEIKNVLPNFKLRDRLELRCELKEE